MKKITVIVLLLIYGCSTTGATVHLHYCMNEFVGWSLWQSGKNQQCGKCGMKEEKDGCCKDEHKQVKLDTEHQKIAFSQYASLTEEAALTASLITFSCEKPAIASTTPALYSAPEMLKERRYLLHCVFLI